MPTTTKPKTKTPRSTKAKNPPLREIGASGTVFSHGYLVSEDINSKWRSLKSRMRIIEEMRKTDAQVRAGLLVCKMPLIASRWHVKPPDEPTDLEVEIADFVSENINGMEMSWTETLSQILTYFDFGFSVFEKVFVLRDDKYWWRKWAHRHQGTIEKWNVYDDGSLRSVTQNTWKGDGYRQIDLGADRLLVFTNWKEGSNYEGESMLRSAYKPWYLKSGLYITDAIAHERHGVGVPKITLPPGAGDPEMDYCERILEDWRSHEKGYVIVPSGFLVEIMAIPTQLRDPLGSIQHHDEQIARSVLAQFLNLGFSQSGSRALGQATSDFFLASLNTYSSYIAGIINEGPIPQLVDINFGPQDRYPELEAIPIAGIDFERMARSLMMLAQNSLVHPDRDLISHVHKIMGLPNPDFNDNEFVRDLNAAPTAQGPAKMKAKPKQLPTIRDEDARFANFVGPTVTLQVRNVVNSASTSKNGDRFRPPMEGTLLQALYAASDTYESPLLTKAAREFSRRLASAAEYAVASGEDIETAVEEESRQSMPILLRAVYSARLHNLKSRLETVNESS
jgi:phage gp29-like protein